MEAENKKGSREEEEGRRLIRGREEGQAREEKAKEEEGGE